ncbi:MAG TPA: hypothetical protein VMJ30_07125 [Gemmatimonadales bacterium]|nr:hypothetical protein [Gemmatimonadales bacterium]
MSDPRSGPPARLDRTALDRVLKRATELQAGEKEIGDSVTPDEVISLGREVGIPARYLQQAMLEEQVRGVATTPDGLLDGMVGSARCSAGRVVRGDPEAVEEALVEWMDANELLAIERRQPGKVSWEPLSGMQVALRRSAAVLGNSKRPFMLSRASRIMGQVTALEPGFCHVTLGAELGSTRASYLGGSAALLALGVAASGILAVMTPILLVAAAPLPIAAVVSWTVMRQFRPVRDRVQLGLERALDHLEQRDHQKPRELPPGRPSLVGLITEEIRKALKP